MKTVISNVHVFLIILLAGPAAAQSALERYVREGLKNNVVLQQRSIGLEKAMFSLQIANSYFSPSVGLQGNYTSGLGGRTIAIPVGDLLNPVYSSLNQLTGSEKFPQIANVKQNFFPYNFYDGKMHTAVPIVNTDLVFNRKIAQQQILLQEFEVDIYRRELIKNIKVAYFNYLSALGSVRIYESALNRAEQGKRVNQSLLTNGKGLPAYVLRSQAEIETVRSQIADAERQIENAQLYFNFLLNRGNLDEIEVADVLTEEFPVVLLTNWDSTSIYNREEIKMARTTMDLDRNLISMSKYFWVPKLNGFLDLGSQAQDWKVSQQSRYYLLGMQLDIPLFGGFRNRSKVKQAQLEYRSAELGLKGSRQQLDLSARVSRNNVFASKQNFLSAQKQLEASQSYQRLIEKGYLEGVNTFIEAVDARNQLTQAQLLVTINRYRVLSAAAQFERETASYTLAINEK